MKVLWSPVHYWTGITFFWYRAGIYDKDFHFYNTSRVREFQDNLVFDTIRVYVPLVDQQLCCILYPNLISLLLWIISTSAAPTLHEQVAALLWQLLMTMMPLLMNMVRGFHQNNCLTLINIVPFLSKLQVLLYRVCHQANWYLFAGLIRQPKWGHMKDLHAAIKLCEPALIAVDGIGQYTWLGSNQEVLNIFILCVFHVKLVFVLVCYQWNWK